MTRRHTPEDVGVQQHRSDTLQYYENVLQWTVFATVAGASVVICKKFSKLGLNVRIKYLLYVGAYSLTIQ